MAQQALDRVQVDAGLEQVRGKRVPQGVNAAQLGDARAPLRQGIRPLQPRGIEWLRSMGGGKQPRGGPRHGPIRAQGVQQRRRQDRVAVTSPFALLDPNRPARRVDVPDPQMEYLAQPQTRRVGRQQHRAVGQVRRVGDQPLDLVPAEEGR
jgi:hypothetical protein